jgi:hypothetical protein
LYKSSILFLLLLLKFKNLKLSGNWKWNGMFLFMKYSFIVIFFYFNANMFLRNIIYGKYGSNTQSKTYLNELVINHCRIIVFPYSFHLLTNLCIHIIWIIKILNRLFFLNECLILSLTSFNFSLISKQLYSNPYLNYYEI